MSDRKTNSKATGKEEKGGKDNKSEAEAGNKAEGGKSGTTVVDLGFLEADDDFEEFPTETWKSTKMIGEANGLNGVAGEEEDAEANIWEDNWDDDNIEEDFSKQLK